MGTPQQEDYDGGGGASTENETRALALTPLGTSHVATAAQSAPFNRQQIELIKQTIAAGASDLELDFFLEVCRLTGLNPFQRQIYAIMRNVKDGGDRWVKRMTIQTGIDGYRLIAARTGQLAGIDDALFDTEDADHPARASVTVWRFVAGQRVPFTATARWREYVQTSKDGKLTGKWGDMPYLMLGKCAEALALRKAFPAELSGVYTHEEMAQAEDGPVVTVAADTSAAAHDWEDVKKLAGALNLSPDEKAALSRKHNRNAEAIYQALAAQLAAQAVAADTDPDPPTPEPDQEPAPVAADATSRPYHPLGDLAWRARAERIGYSSVDAIELLLERAGLTAETATREECEAALHAEEMRAAAVLGPTTATNGAKSGKSGSK